MCVSHPELYARALFYQACIVPMPITGVVSLCCQPLFPVSCQHQAIWSGQHMPDHSLDLVRPSKQMVVAAVHGIVLKIIKLWQSFIDMLTVTASIAVLNSSITAQAVRLIPRSVLL